MQVAWRAFSRDWARTGIKRAARIATTPTTTNSSISVKPARGRIARPLLRALRTRTTLRLVYPRGAASDTSPSPIVLKIERSLDDAIVVAIARKLQHRPSRGNRRGFHLLDDSARSIDLPIL